VVLPGVSSGGRTMEQSNPSTRGRTARGATWLVSGVALAAAAACYPTGVDNTSDFNTVTTVYDTTFSANGGFQALTTYSIPGATVANPQDCVIEDLADGGTYNFTNPLLPTTICSTLADQLNDLGYTLVDPAQTPGSGAPPDFIVTVAALNQSYTAYVSYPWYGYWGGYYPYYPWYGWGIYYPWGGYYYSYNVGTLVITMVKPNLDASIPDGGQMNAIWAGALNGLATSSNVTPPIVSAGIVQAFTQSPYLGKQ
jgi:hypothetical protein